MWMLGRICRGIITIASYYAGIEIPFVGEGVALYGTMRLTWDVFFDFGQITA